jgi:hypothetical protein
MRRTVDYCLIQNVDLQKLMTDIGVRLKEGFEPVGCVSTTYITTKSENNLGFEQRLLYIQTMAKYEYTLVRHKLEDTSSGCSE